MPSIHQKRPSEVKVGDQFGSYTVVNMDVPRIKKAKACMRRCACGKERHVRIASLTRLISQSCCCHVRNVPPVKPKSQRTHGESASGGRRTPEYMAWGAMKSRCYNHHAPQYPGYGGRGIQMCDRWRESFERFLEDMGRRPSPGHSLDRIDVNGNYEPGNCRWATAKQQSRNVRTNCLIMIDGVTKTAVEWSEQSGLHQGTISRRARRGIAGQALLAPADPVKAQAAILSNRRNRELC